MTEERAVRRAFVMHFKKIYSAGPRKGLWEVYSPNFLAGLPQIPSFIGPSLDSLPSDLEIYKSLMSLGPHKSAGPDGFNAFLLQQEWPNFGPLILKEVHQFFITGMLPSSIAKSNLILIPKVGEPS